MNYLHSQAHIGPDCAFLVELSSQANVHLLDEANFRNYKAGRRFDYCGGWVRRSPIRMCPPHMANWHIVIDLGGHAGSIRASIEVVNG